MPYEIVRFIHLACVAATATLMLLRLAIAYRGDDYRRFGMLRWVPHAIDTCLLGSAVTLAVLSGQYPGVQSWLTAKLVALVMYIGLGAVALRPGIHGRWRIAAAAGAVLTFCFIVAVAMQRKPLPFLP